MSLPALRIGEGWDTHQLVTGRPLILGGITIPHSHGLLGHSDADALAHAITDALLGAAAAGDIGEMFSDRDPANRGKDSLDMLRAAVNRLADAGWRVRNVDVTIVAERPRVSSHRELMRARLAPALGIDTDDVSVKGKTNEGMGWIGRGEGIACIAVATIVSTGS